MAESQLNEFARDSAGDETGLWVFGYGSLCWHQGFEFDKSLTGFVEGFSRKFWQGNTTHRGTENKPGRVATLIEDGEGIVWGQAFKVKDEKAIPYLNNRECELGGYMTTITTFYPRREQRNRETYTKPFPVVLYVATPSNRLWLGDSPLADIANQIVECTGGSGHNVEYLLRLANFVRENIPEAVDEHLFALEILVRTLIQEKNLCLEELMGEKRTAEDDRGAASGSLQFAEMVTSKKLRCVNI
ncbi:UNVERIFIED_CONTAM: hypothetical protein PYX00_003809 [Menopon gallinae]|uniref:glutathione-specific gamma-glutamylcyclotransferase n=1 Tax=Menopon gallinae TaxID=328185 RepID=A0AAW2I1H2_9NEOP